MRYLVGILVLGLVGCSVTHEGDASLYVGYGGDTSQPEEAGGSESDQSSGGHKASDGTGGEGNRLMAESPGGNVGSGGAEASAGGSDGRSTGGQSPFDCGECPNDHPVCDETTGECVKCTSDQHCTSGHRNRCDLNLNSCVECLSDSDCGGDLSRCNMVSEVDGGYVRGGECVECMGHEDCSGSLDRCYFATDSKNFCAMCSNGDERYCQGYDCSGVQSCLSGGMAWSSCHLESGEICSGASSDTGCPGSDPPWERCADESCSPPWETCE